MHRRKIEKEILTDRKLTGYTTTTTTTTPELNIARLVLRALVRKRNVRQHCNFNCYWFIERSIGE